jgi:hypothetical protein
MELILVKPAPGLKVRDPDTRLHIPDDGAEVPDTNYWRRRIKAGDVSLVTPTVEQTATLEKEE